MRRRHELKNEKSGYIPDNARTRGGPEDEALRQTQPLEDANPKSFGEENPTGKKVYQTHVGIEGHKQQHMNDGQHNFHQKPVFSNNKLATCHTRRQRTNSK